MKKFKSPLHEMSQTTPTDFWNDSCSIKELKYAIENGAVGATTNPVIVNSVLTRELNDYENQIHELIEKFPDSSEDEITWKLNEEMAVAGAKLLEPIFDTKTGNGRISIQTNTKFFNNTKLLVEQAQHFNKLAKNIQVKIPATIAGIKAFEEATYRGVSINATVSFSVPQAVQVAQAVERGMKRRENEGLDISNINPVCTIMVGRLDDWLKIVANQQNIIVDPESFEWAGVLVFKKAYKIFKERSYRIRLLVAAYRNHHHWSQFIGSDTIGTIPYMWQKRYNNSGIEIRNRMDDPPNQRILNQLLNKFPDFVKAYNEDGMLISDFDNYGPVNKTLLQFLEGYDELVKIIRSFIIKIK